MTEEEEIAKLITLDHQVQLLSLMVHEFISELREAIEDRSIDTRRDNVVE